MGTARMLLFFAFAMTVKGTTIWNRAKGLIPQDPRDTQKFTDPTNAMPVHLDIAGFDVEVATDTYTVYGSPANVIRCFQGGFCLAGDTDPGTATPTVNPAGTGMATDMATVFLGPFVLPVDDTIYTYEMWYRKSNFALGKNDLQRLAAEITKIDVGDPNDVDVTAWNALIVGWKIYETANADTKVANFQLAIVHDGTNTYVLYLYGEITTGVADNVRGYLSGGSAAQSGRICNIIDAPDAILADADLPKYSNYRCGNPGVYVLKAAAADACAGTNMDCANSYLLAEDAAKPNCNVSAVPQDTCTETYFCQFDATDQRLVKLDVSVKNYAYADPYIQFLKFDAFMDQANGGSLTEPKGIQEFVSSSAEPVAGECGMVLPTDTRTGTLSMTIDLDEGDEDTRCGIKIDDGDPKVIYFAYKIFEWDQTGTAFGKNENYDKPGDGVFFSPCYPGDYTPTVQANIEFHTPQAPTAMPVRARTQVLEACDRQDDANANVLTSIEMGRAFFWRICFEPGTPFNPNADPFAIYAHTCFASNKADFTPVDTTREYSEEFIGADSCPVANPPGPFFYVSDFQVRTGYAYGDTPAKWCLYSTEITAQRWNKYTAAAVPLHDVYVKCIVGYCYLLDGEAGTDEKQCHDRCTTAKRRKRSDSNETSAYPNEEEVVYGSIRIIDPDAQSNTLHECSDESTDFKIAVATVATLLALLVLSVLAAIFVFVRVMRLNKLNEKIRPYK